MLQKIVFLKKNDWPSFNFVNIFAIICCAILVTAVIMSTYVLISLLLVGHLQDLLIIVTLICIRFFHRIFANERYYFASYSYLVSGFTVSCIFAFLAMQYTVENPVILGENLFIIGKYSIEIKSIQEMGAMYGLVFLQAFDTLIAFFTSISKKENELKFISIIMLLISVVFIVYTMSVTISITLI